MVRKSEQRESFVVRIWQEQGCSRWKGWIYNVRTDESAFLDDVDDLATFVRRWTTEPTGEQQQGLR